MNLSDLPHDAVNLAGLIDGASVLFDQCATEPCPSSSAMVPVLDAIAKHAHSLANDLDAMEREK